MIEKNYVGIRNVLGQLILGYNIRIHSSVILGSRFRYKYRVLTRITMKLFNPIRSIIRKKVTYYYHTYYCDNSVIITNNNNIAVSMSIEVLYSDLHYARII